MREKTGKRYNLYLKMTVYDKLTELAEKSGLSRSEIINIAVEDYYKNKYPKDVGVNHSQNRSIRL